jgi:hypothetical protein
MNIETHLAATSSGLLSAKPVAVLTAVPIKLLVTIWQCSLNTVRCIAATGANLVAVGNSRAQQIVGGTTTVSPESREDLADVIPLSRDRECGPKRE